MHKRVLVYSCLPWILVSSILATPLTNEQVERFESFLKTLIKCRDNSGITVSLVRNGKTVYANGFGLRDRELHRPMEADTLINIGSLTKAFTSTLAADAVGKGLATWDTPLQTILGPEFGMEGEFRTREVCLRDIMAHKVGVPSYWGVGTSAMNVTREELCMNRFRYFPVKYDFRSRLYYANYPYVLTGYVTEVLTGSPWEQHIRDALLDPLEMSHTKVSAELTDSDWNNVAYSYVVSDGEYIVNPEKDQLIFLTELGPAAAVFSSAVDIGKWMQFQLNEGRTPDGRQLIPVKALQETHKPQSALDRESPKISRPRFPVEDSQLAYGMGWNAGTYRGYEKSFHNGGYSSYNCRLSLLPEVDIGAWACVNSPGSHTFDTSVQLATTFALDILLDKDPWLNDTTACTFPSPWQREIDDLGKPKKGDQVTDNNIQNKYLNQIPVLVKKRRLQDYAGEFGHKAFGLFSIFPVSDNQLRYSLGTLLKGEVNPSGTNDMFYMTLDYPLSYSMFFYPSNPRGFPLYFAWDQEGRKVVSVKIPYLESDLPPLFVRGVKPDRK